ncbi:cellulose biosynthesis cyclic di-GMP-binding regulatory protein BcsB [Caballeronia insecticola]|uniref:Putative transmembrane anchor protein n=1 Tax=Caballeronia insecticola TaxID=758793 RepID=R4WU22_9BURK|nr:cellulose biosynthesis cyclic di-GMP-binding regulatory protein BcsB [Caballeronia insecticola]BAN28069.1 putative transmembrane anchor protein [Caballeronia insecticola]
MINDNSKRRRMRAVLVLLGACFVFLAAVPRATLAASVADNDIAGAFGRLGLDVQETRTVTLRQLGLLESVTLNAPDTRREFFLPVPANVPISDATLQVDGGYVRGDGGRVTMLLSLDGSPVLARAFTQESGGVAVNLGVDGAPRSAGFVRLGLGFASVINQNDCTDQTAIGNVLRVDPTTRLTFRFNPADVQDLRTAWSALPYAPVLAIAGRKLSTNAYDTAWRTNALLQRDGKRPVMQALPAVGETVDLSNIDVPVALRSVPAFAALAAGGKHAIADQAQLGALVALAPRTAFGPDVVVADEAMRRTIGAALDALRLQVANTSGDALAAFDAWRKRTASQLTTPLAPGEVRVAHVGGRALIVVGDTRGIGALAHGWRPIDVSDRVVVHRIDVAQQTHGDTIALSDLGGDPRSIDVQTNASWDARFDLAAASGNGRLPEQVVLDIAASPTLSNGGATATVYFNDVMIGARLINVDGARQRLIAPIPRYALARTNDLRVSLRRQPDGGCQARQTYPVAILPTSHLRLAKATPVNTFAGMAARYASSATVYVPRAYLDDALDSVPRLAVLTGAAGIAPVSAKFAVSAPQDATQPDGPFLAADVRLADEKNPAVYSADRLSLTSPSGDTLLDMSGLSRVGVVSVASAGGQSGIVYRSAGTAPVLTDKLQLSRGDIAVVDGSGVLKQFDTVGADELTDEPATSTDWVTRHWARWGIPAVLVVLLLALIALAGAARRKHRNAQRGNNGDDGDRA